MAKWHVVLAHLHTGMGIVVYGGLREDPPVVAEQTATKTKVDRMLERYEMED